MRPRKTFGTIPDIQIPYTNDQAAAVLGVKPGTLEVWRCRGDGPVYMKIGRAVRYRHDDLVSFMEAGRRRSTSE